jgi:hypothetical protein
MRAALCWVLLAFGLLAFVLARPSLPATAQVQAPNAHVEIDGYGETALGAETVAQERAQQKVEEELSERFAATGWQPPADKVKTRYLLEKGVIRSVKTERVKVDGAERWRAIYHVEINNSYLSTLKEIAREQRMIERHFLLARVLAAVVVVLLAVFGYLRLEDATRGYYTRALRLGAVGLVVLAGLGLWLSL